MDIEQFSLFSAKLKKIIMVQMHIKIVGLMKNSFIDNLSVNYVTVDSKVNKLNILQQHFCTKYNACTILLEHLPIKLFLVFPIIHKFLIMIFLSLNTKNCGKIVHLDELLENSKKFNNKRCFGFDNISNFNI